MEVAGFWIALLALILGFFHLHGIWSQAKGLRAQAQGLLSQAKLSQLHKEQLESIEKALTTRHIGQFPEYMKDIADLMEHSNQEVLILCDFPAYGCFSAPQDFLRYRQAIERKIDAHLPVRVTTLGSSRRVALTQEQYPKWEQWKNKPTSRNRLSSFLKLHGDIAIGELTVERFANLLEEEDLKILDHSLKNARVSKTEDHLPIYFWLIDGKAAVFSIPSFTEKATEHGFYTSDPRLIAGLQDLEARYRRRPGS